MYWSFKHKHQQRPSQKKKTPWSSSTPTPSPFFSFSLLSFSHLTPTTSLQLLILKSVCFLFLHHITTFFFFYIKFFSYDLWAMQTYNFLTTSSRSLIRIFLVLSLCFRFEEWFLSIVCIDTYKDKKIQLFFFLGGSSFFVQITFRKIPLFYNDGTVINTFWQLHVCQITLYSFLFFNVAAS